MLAILNSLNAHNYPILQPIMLILVSKCMVHGVFLIKHTYHLGCCPPFKRSSNYEKDAIEENHCLIQ